MFTPLRMCVVTSPEPSRRCTFCVRMSALFATALPIAPNRKYECVLSSVGATDHLDGVVAGGAPRRINSREHHDNDRRDKRRHILRKVFAHQKSFGFHEPFKLDRKSP